RVDHDYVVPKNYPARVGRLPAVAVPLTEVHARCDLPHSSGGFYLLSQGGEQQCAKHGHDQASPHGIALRSPVVTVSAAGILVEGPHDFTLPENHTGKNACAKRQVRMLCYMTVTCGRSEGATACHQKCWPAPPAIRHTRSAC